MAGTNPNLAVFFGGVCLLLAYAYVVFRVIVRREYSSHGHLTVWSSTLQLLAFAGLMAFPYLFNPPKWALPWLLAGSTSPQQQLLGLVIILLGLLVGFGTMGWFGIRQAFGIEVKGLISTGPYRLTRNPQFLGFSAMVIGVAVQWPSWFAIVWIGLYGVMSHWMIITEEEHLRASFGEEYVRYCQKVPRYLFWVGNSKKDTTA
ncbi:MAG TPA: isoprenylcysteine carboxylmethyltransferase family protein [Anaerolineaceae bacterium]|nr:isoprenylcysteine carboxylmethyltransferase family protein [Anaerolineaceae bacterium]